MLEIHANLDSITARDKGTNILEQILEHWHSYNSNNGANITTTDKKNFGSIADIL